MFRHLLQVIVPCVFLAGSCSGQSAATINGVVRNTRGEPAAGVKLEVVGAKTAEKRTAVSGSDGAFQIPQIPPDSYQILASCDRCADSATTVEVGAGQSRRVEMEVNTESASSVVAVDTRATTMDQSSARLGTNITAAEISQLPVNGRTYAPLALAAPGAINRGEAGFSDIRFHGQSSEQNSFRMDGLDVSGVVSASPGFTAAPGFQFRLRASVDTIQEFRVDSAAYAADQGGATGGQINLISKAGGNQWHGSLFESFRNDKLDARNFYDKSMSELRLNQFGASAGGHLVKDKLFVFGSYEDLRQRAGLNIFDAVPSDRTFSNAAPIVQLVRLVVPLPSIPFGDGSLAMAHRSGVAAQDERSYSARLDYVPSDRNRFFLRAQRADGNLYTPDTTVFSRTIATSLRSDDTVASWNLNAGTVVNELVAGVNRAPTTMAVDPHNPTYLGFRLLIGDLSGGFISPGDLTMLPSGDYGSRAEYRGRSYQLTDHLTWLHSAHSVKVGGELTLVRVPLQLGGGMTYHFIDLAGSMLDQDADLALLGNVPFHVAAQERYAGYVQDDWRVSPTLTLNFGVRYEYFSPTREVNDHARIFDIATMRFTAAHGGFYPVSRLGFNPRFGLAWAPDRLHGNTVLRLGAGSYEGPFALGDTIQPIEDDTFRYYLNGQSFPTTPQQMLTNPKLQGLPLGMDRSGYRHNSRNYQLSLSLQQALPGKLVGQAAYVGSVARHLTQLGAANPIISLDPNSGDMHRQVDALSKVSYVTNGGTSSFNALELGLTRRFVDELTMNVSYMWAHSLGSTSGAGEAAAAQNPACLACERSATSFDVRQSLNSTLVYDFPFGMGRRHLNRGLIAHLAGNWSMAGAWNVRTGLPLNATISRPDRVLFDPLTGLYYSKAAPNLPATAISVLNTPGGGEGRPALRPNLVPGVDPYLRDKHSGLWLNPAAFAAPLPGTFGNLGRNALRGPGFSQIDLQVSRRFALTERQAVALRVEAFNLLNHANFANPETLLPPDLTIQPGEPFNTAQSSTFGLLRSTVGQTVGLGTSRQVQLSLHYEW